MPKLPTGEYRRLPLAFGDVHVDRNDRSAFRQVLQFGVRNLCEAELEWLVVNTFEHRPGTVTLPPERARPT
ncbi:hypothetical protein [Streptomyces meridianus]|uniref:Uncharacterized protein n=1 Tax=Streptomyces meridianus TaxID=2938945 RepID=A0ABT0XA16_9ACTN|nr:hypothetical protein [Streptomyces meridianus]MCM2579373.1 hypothetical protein [Streptomyces meridianus]